MTHLTPSPQYQLSLRIDSHMACAVMNACELDRRVYTSQRLVAVRESCR